MIVKHFLYMDVFENKGRLRFRAWLWNRPSLLNRTNQTWSTDTTTISISICTNISLPPHTLTHTELVSALNSLCCRGEEKLQIFCIFSFSWARPARISPDGVHGGARTESSLKARMDHYELENIVITSFPHLLPRSCQRVARPGGWHLVSRVAFIIIILRCHCRDKNQYWQLWILKRNDGQGWRLDVQERKWCSRNKVPKSLELVPPACWGEWGGTEVWWRWRYECNTLTIHSAENEIPFDTLLKSSIQQRSWLEE